jgi:hypothetical protein
MTRKTSPKAVLVERFPGLALLVVLVTLLSIWSGAHSDDTKALQSKWPATDFSRRTVALDEIISGGPPRDGIPAIDQPRFVAFGEADAWLHPKEPVIALAVDNTARAYPLQILMFHEIVNDTLAGVAVSVTFCPLCNAAIVFDRRVAGRTLSFGTTGQLRKSDMVMYDRQTESWWQQFTGRGIVGFHAGQELVQLPSQIVAYAEFKAAYPGGTVLSRETGHQRPYGRNPYRGYDRIGENPFLFSDPVDSRLPAMERVLAASLKGVHRLYPLSHLERLGVVNDTLKGTPIVAMSSRGMLSPLDDAMIARSRTIVAAAAFERRVAELSLSFEIDGGVIRDRETGSQWNVLGQAVSGPMKGRRLSPVPGGVHFAFAWLAFQPQSEIYAGGKAGIP